MKLLHVISSIDPAGGGPVEGVRQLRAALREHGVEAHVCCGDAQDAPFVRTSEMSVFALGPSRSKYGFNLRLLAWLRQHHGEYDAIIVEGLWQFHTVAVRLALRGSATPYFAFVHGMLDPWFRRNYPLKHLKKSLYWLLSEYWLLRGARGVLFTCAEEQRQAHNAFWPYRCREVVMTYGTAQPPSDGERLRETFLSRFPALRGKPIALFLGRIHEKKGCDLLIDAFATVAAQAPELQLVMAGPADPALQGRLARHIDAIGLRDRVTWTGMLSGDLKWGAFNAAEIFCLPSHQENFGVAVAEALGCGLPVLVSDKVNIWREIIEDGAGLAGPDSLAGTVSCLRRWLDTEPAAREHMRAAARACFRQRFQVERAAQCLLEIIRQAGATPLGVELEAQP